MAHEYFDKHGNLWSDIGRDGAYKIIHSESNESAAAGFADASSYAKKMQDAAKAFDESFS